MPCKVLIVVDMQNDFVTGPLGTPEARAIVPAVVNKIEAFLSESEDHFVVFTKDTHTSSYLRSLEGKYLPVEHCLLGSSGRDVISELDAFYKSPRAVSKPKTTFGYDNWDTYFGRSTTYTFELIGVCTDICVVSNALILRAYYPNAQITVDASCCAGTTPEKHKAALDVMRSCQIDVIGDETNA